MNFYQCRDSMNCIVKKVGQNNILLLSSRYDDVNIPAKWSN